MSDDRYRSRTFWQVMILYGLATGLCAFNLIEGAGWITTVLAVFAGWQGRRYADNKLHVNGDK